MKKKFKTIATSGAIQTDGYLGSLQDVQILDTEEVIEEAIGRHYVNESKHVVQQIVQGLLNSMIDGCSRDGNGRRIDGYLQIMPYMTGLINKKNGQFDREKQKIIVRARLLKEMEVDTSTWSLTNVTEGRVLDLYDIATVDSDDVEKVTFGKEAEIHGIYLQQSLPEEGVWVEVLKENGKDIETDLGACTVVKSDIHTLRIKLPATCRSYIGRKLRFTVKGYAGQPELRDLQNQPIEAELLAGEDIPEPEFNSLYCDGAGEGYVPDIGSFKVRGNNLSCFKVGDTLKAVWTPGMGGEPVVGQATITAATDSELTVQQADDVTAGSQITYSADVGGYTPTVSGEVMGI